MQERSLTDLEEKLGEYHKGCGSSRRRCSCSSHCLMLKHIRERIGGLSWKRMQRILKNTKNVILTYRMSALKLSILNLNMLFQLLPTSLQFFFSKYHVMKSLFTYSESLTYVKKTPTHAVNQLSKSSVYPSFLGGIWFDFIYGGPSSRWERECFKSRMWRSNENHSLEHLSYNW